MPLNFVEQYARKAARLPRLAKASIAVVAAGMAMPAALFAAVALRNDSIGAAIDVPAWLYCAAGLMSVVIFALTGTYRTVLRFISREGLLISCAAALIASG